MKRLFAIYFLLYSCSAGVSEYQATYLKGWEEVNLECKRALKEISDADWKHIKGFWVEYGVDYSTVHLVMDSSEEFKPLREKLFDKIQENLK